MCFSGVENDELDAVSEVILDLINVRAIVAGDRAGEGTVNDQNGFLAPEGFECRLTAVQLMDNQFPIVGEITRIGVCRIEPPILKSRDLGRATFFAGTCLEGKVGDAEGQKSNR